MMGMCEVLASADVDSRLEAIKLALAQHLDGAAPHDDISVMLIDARPG